MGTRAGDLQQQLPRGGRVAASGRGSVTATWPGGWPRRAWGDRSLARLDQLRGENEQRRAAYWSSMRLAAALGNEIAHLESQAAAAAATRRAMSRAHRRTRLHAGRRSAATDELRRQLDRRRPTRRKSWPALADAKDQLAQQPRPPAAGESDSELRQRHSGAAERAAVLDELVRRQEGLGAGVKEVLARAAGGGPRARRPPACRAWWPTCSTSAWRPAPGGDRPGAGGPARGRHAAARAARTFWNAIRPARRPGGLCLARWRKYAVTNLFGSRHGPCRHRRLYSSRAGRASSAGPTGSWRPSRFSRWPGAVGANLVRREAWPTPWSWLTAEVARAELRDPFRRAAGTATARWWSGRATLPSGLISRRSQLRALRTQLGELQAAIETAAAAAADALGEQITAQQQQVDRRTAEYQQAADAMAENRVAIAAAEERRSQLDQQRAALDRNAKRPSRAGRGRRSVWPRPKKSEQLEAALSEMERPWPGLASRSTGWRSAARPPAARPPRSRSSWPSARSGCGTSRPACGSSRKAGRSAQRAIEEARSNWPSAARRGETRRADSPGRIRDRRALPPQGGFRRADRRAGRAAAKRSQQQRAALAAEIQKIHARLRKMEEKIHAVDLSANEVRHERSIAGRPDARGLRHRPGRAGA